MGRLKDALVGGEIVCTTGLVLQELLHGCKGPRDGRLVVDLFADIAMIVPSRDDHVEAARLRTACRRRGTQVGTIDALQAQICIRHSLLMRATDRDFCHIAESTSLHLWRAT